MTSITPTPKGKPEGKPKNDPTIPAVPPNGHSSDEPVNPFDLKALRERRASGKVGALKVFQIEVRKPKSQVYFRVCPGDDYCVDCELFVAKDTGTIFWVGDAAISAFPPGSLTEFCLYTCISAQGSPFLWPAKMPSEGGRQRLRAGWARLKLALAAEMDPEGEVTEGDHFRAQKFEEWLCQREIAWPRLAITDRLNLDKDVFKEMSELYPELQPIRQLRHTLSQLRLEDLSVGRDGRNRTSLFPFAAKTGRNQPSNSKFIFGPSKWLRSIIKPSRGRVLAYIDWRAQEIGVAAALSGDEALLSAVKSGDPYIYFAKMAGLAPSDATKSSHPAVRDVCKVLFLATNYGSGVAKLANRLKVCIPEAKHLLDTHKRVFSTFQKWADNQVDIAMLESTQKTRFGWPHAILPNANPRTVRNFPVQANANEMLRIACCLATEAGIRVCCPVHDAVLIEVDEATADEEIQACREHMAQASRVVLDGLELETEVEVVRWPDRYVSAGGEVMWERVMSIIDSFQ